MERATENPQDNMMLPPPPRTFKDREELITYAREFGVSQGYVLTIRKSKRDNSVVLGCDRGGSHRNRSKPEAPKRKRKEASRLINCPFEIVGKKDDDVWEIKVRNGEHNHEPLKDMSEHRFNQRFTEEEAKQVKEMLDAGLKPREVLQTLKQNNPQLKSTPRHLYNLKTKIRKGNFSECSFKSWRPNALTVGSSCGKVHPTKVSNFIGGKFVESEGIVVDVVNPATQEVVSHVPSSTYEEFRAAVNSAKQAFSAWKNTPVFTRQRIMIKFLELINRDKEKLALIISTEQGKTLKSAHADIIHSLEVVEHSCEVSAVQLGEFVANASNSIDMYTIREPLGVCAGICNPNISSMVPLWMFPVAVTCGNTFVLKPSEKNSGTSMKLAELAIEAGLPDGVFNIVYGRNDIVNYMCHDDDIKAISFAGSYMDGMDLYAKATARGKRVEVNTGSKYQAVVLPDACIDSTLDALVASAFVAAGDPYMALSSVIFVGDATPWEEELVKRAKTLKVGVGTDATADVGPLVSNEVKYGICRSVQNAVESGARLLLDGRNILVPGYEGGNFVGPTILSGVTTNMECYKEDISGPLLLCTQVCSLEEAITLVNQHKYGNGVTLFTTSGIAARKFQNEVEIGLIGINVSVPFPLPNSSAGLTDSLAGNTNFHGKTGIQLYTQVKMVAQKWSDLTTGGFESRKPSTSDKGTINQAAPPIVLSSLDTDLSNQETSHSLTRSSSREMTGQGMLEYILPTENDLSSSATSTRLASTSEVHLPNRTISLASSLVMTEEPENQLDSPRTCVFTEALMRGAHTSMVSQGNDVGPQFGGTSDTSMVSRGNDVCPQFGASSDTSGPQFSATIHTSGPQFGATIHTSGPQFGATIHTSGPQFGATSERRYTSMASQRAGDIFQSGTSEEMRTHKMQEGDRSVHQIHGLYVPVMSQGISVQNGTVADISHDQVTAAFFPTSERT